jgi:hypothetical protein
MLMKELVVSTITTHAVFLPVGELGAKHNPHSALKSAKMEWYTFTNTKESHSWVIKS